MLLLFLLIVFVLTEDVEVDVIVIGSGSSGLGAASVLAQNGKKVALLEQCPNFGGSIQSFTREGKSGATYQFEPDPSIFDYISGEKIQMNPFGEYVDLLFPNITSDPLQIPTGIEEAFKYMEEKFPDEVKAIKEYSNVLSTTKSMNVTMENLLDRITDNKALKFALSYMEGYSAFAPYPVVVYAGLISFAYGGGGSFPAGSSAFILEGVKDVITNAGSEIHLACPATKLMLDDDEKVEGVEAACGTFKAKYVISTMGAKNTFNEDFVDKSVLEKYGYISKVGKLEDSFTGMIYFLGFNTTNDNIGLPSANVWYNSLNDDEEEEDDDFAIKEIFSSCLSCRDPDYPSGVTDFFVLSLVKYDLFKPWEDTKTHHRPQDYYDFKKKFEDRALKWVFTLYPQAEKYLDVVVTSSPLTIRDYLNHSSGSIYGINVSPESMSWIKMQTEIEGLLVAGQDVDGGGVQGNMFNGIQAGQLILKKEG